MTVKCNLTSPPWPGSGTADPSGKLVEILRHSIQGKTGCSVSGQKTLARQSRDQCDTGYPMRHRTSHVRVCDTVSF